MQAHRTTWLKKTTADKSFCRQTKMFLPEPEHGTWKKIRGRTKRNIKILTQMITGHATLRYHLFKMKIEPEATCEHCQEGDETVEHFICECEAYAYPRYQAFGAHFLKQEDLRTMDYDVLLEYIKTTKRLL